MIVPSENWSAYQLNRDAWNKQYDGDVTRVILSRLQLIPVPHQLYVTVDDQGHWFDYGHEQTPDDWEGVVRKSFGARDLVNANASVVSGTVPSNVNRPIENSYVVASSCLVAGEYPGSPPSTSPSVATAKIGSFLDAGITAFLDLTDPADGLADYAPALLQMASARGIEVTHERMIIRDNGICDATHMNRILDVIDSHLAEGRRVYVHCWGGVGRTGMVVGCWLVRHGRDGEEALREVGALFRTVSAKKVQDHAGWGSPQTEPQRDVVRGWQAQSHTAEKSRGTNWTGFIQSVSALDRYLGAMLGLASGDALGTTLEFSSPGSFEPLTDMVGGGPFHLKPGQWTDDTSMALCLAESLVECDGFDPLDQMRRYVRWRDEGYWSSTGVCFDVGNVVNGAIWAFRQTGDAFSGPVQENTAGNGSLMRLAPVPLFFVHDAELAIRMAAESSRTTHGATIAIDACRYFAGLLVAALNGVPKQDLLSDHFSPVAGLWNRESLHPAVAVVAAGSFRRKSPPAIKGGKGYVVDTLEAALWAFATTSDFASGALAAVNLGGDADTSGAVYGQLAGAYYGAKAIPESWLGRIALGEKIAGMTTSLFHAAERRSS